MHVARTNKCAPILRGICVDVLKREQVEKFFQTGFLLKLLRFKLLQIVGGKVGEGSSIGRNQSVEVQTGQQKSRREDLRALGSTQLEADCRQERGFDLLDVIDDARFDILKYVVFLACNICVRHSEAATLTCLEEIPGRSLRVDRGCTRQNLSVEAHVEDDVALFEHALTNEIEQVLVVRDQFGCHTALVARRSGAALR